MITLILLLWLCGAASLSVFWVWWGGLEDGLTLTEMALASLLWPAALVAVLCGWRK